MTARHDLERQVSSWLQSEMSTSAPPGLLEAIQREVEVTPRRPAWRIPDRWLWRHSAGLRVVARGLVLVLVLAALVVVLPLIIGIVGLPAAGATVRADPRGADRRRYRGGHRRRSVRRDPA